MWSGGDYKFEAQDGELEDIEEGFLPFFSMIPSAVNIGPLRHSGAKFGNGYDQAYKMDDNRLVLLAPYVSRAKSMSIGVAGGLGGAIGGAIVGSASRECRLGKTRLCYLISSADTKIQCIDEEVMPERWLVRIRLCLNDIIRLTGVRERRKDRTNAPAD